MTRSSLVRDNIPERFAALLLHNDLRSHRSSPADA